MKTNILPNHAVSFTLFLLTITSFCCKPAKTRITTDETKAVTDSVTLMANHISADITQKGPIAWLDYFEDTPQFFMASDGQLAFANHAAADTFIKTKLIKMFPKITLHWDQLHIDPLTADYAIISGGFKEALIDATGKTMAFQGYFTGTAEHTGHGWQLRNVHWSIQH